MPKIGSTKALITVKAASIDPLELLILTGSVRLIHDHPMPLTLGNECSGIVEKTGSEAPGVKVSDAVYTRLPI